jgi:hypothetical protein
VFSVALSVVGPTEIGDAQALPGSAPNGARTFLERLEPTPLATTRLATCEKDNAFLERGDPPSNQHVLTIA